MKRTVVLISLALIVAGTSAFGFGIGGAFSLGIGTASVGPGAMLSLKLDELPMVFGVGAVIGATEFKAGATVDWWLWDTPLVSILNLYLGPGLYAQLGAGFDVGVRVPIGLQAWIIDPLEIFLEVAPALGLSINDSAQISFPDFELQAALGIRFWF